MARVKLLDGPTAKALIKLTENGRLGDLVNDWRVSSLGLEPVPGMEGHRLAEALEIPFTYCWSPSLVPKPNDWGSHISMTLPKHEKSLCLYQ